MAPLLKNYGPFELFNSHKKNRVWVLENNSGPSSESISDVVVGKKKNELKKMPRNCIHSPEMRMVAVRLTGSENLSILTQLPN